MRLTKRITEKNVDGYVLNHREDFTENTYEVIQKLGKLEDLIENADDIKIIERNGIATLHIDMVLDEKTYPIAKELFKK